MRAASIDVTELNRHELGETIFEKLRARYDAKEQILGAQAMRYHERMVMLSVLDGLWKDHLLAMDHLKEGIGLRGYAQQDPLVAYKKESFDMFEEMMMRFQEDTARHLFRMQIIGPDGQPIDPDGPLPPWMQSQQTLDLPPAETVSSSNASASQTITNTKQAPSQTAPVRLGRCLQRRRVRRRRPSMRWSASFIRRSSGSWRRRARRARRLRATAAPRNATRARRSAATTIAPAAPARSTRSATAPRRRRVTARGRLPYPCRTRFRIREQATTTAMPSFPSLPTP